MHEPAGLLIPKSRNQGDKLGVKATNRSQSRKRSEEYGTAKAGKAVSSRKAYRHGLPRWDEAAASGFAGFDAALTEEFKGADTETALQDLAHARYRQIACELLG